MAVPIARRIGCAIFAIVTAHGDLHAQSVSPPALRFDVASVRPNRRAACFGRWDFAAVHGTVTAANAPLRRIISRAFNLTDDRVSGPAWLDSQCYDIRAKAAAGVPDRDLMPMLQTLLTERFHLVAQRQSDERPIFALMVDEGGLKMRRDGERTPTPPSISDGRMLFMARTLQDLCERLGKVAARPVVDKTGLQGRFEIVLTYLPPGVTDSDPSDPASDIFAAVRDQLGLRLESQRGLVEMLKIQSVDKVPTGN